MLSQYTPFDLLNISAALITIFGAVSFIFKKAANKFKQKLAMLNKGLRYRHIKKLRRQYSSSKLIEANTSYLISYCALKVGGTVLLLMMMSFIGFMFLYLEYGVFKLVGGFYMVLIFGMAINFFDEFSDVLAGSKSPQNYQTDLKSRLNKLKHNEHQIKAAKAK